MHSKGRDTCRWLQKNLLHFLSGTMFETNLLTFFSGLSITCLDRSGEGDSRFPDHHWPIIFDDAGVALPVLP